jgi:hypothetical protein
MPNINNATLVGDQTVLFGTVGYYSGSGIVISGNQTHEADKLEIQDENGYVICTIYFNEKKQFSFEMLIKTAAPTLEPGDLITLAGVAQAEVQKIDIIWTRGAERKVRIEAIRYLGKAIVIPSS